mmetsp:Transcript_26158/g.46563  ORF Transcript_26158/g.46563 Transcript_26158/m.46563 type:complete len:155 (-) Transcript_26158:6244-6708(-)
MKLFCCSCFENKDKRNRYKGLREKLLCPLCNEFLRTTVVTECSHYFCEICLGRHLVGNDSCPVCRVEKPSFRAAADVDSLIPEFLEEDEVILWYRRKQSNQKGRVLRDFTIGADVDIQDIYGRWHAGVIRQVITEASSQDSTPLILVKLPVTFN